MKSIKLLKITTSVLAIVGTIGTSQAFADTSYTSEYVESINMSFPGQAAVINVKNMSANKHVNAVDLKVEENTLNFEMSGNVGCKSANKVAFHGAWAYFGAVGMGGLNNLNTAATVHYDDINVAYTDKQNKLAEYTEDTLSVPYNKVKNAHPVLRVDAVAEVNKKLQAFIQNGGTAVDFYKQDHDIVLQRPVSLVAMCGKPADNTYGYITKNYTVQIKYKGDSAINDKPVLNAQLKGNMPNQIDAGEQPFKLNKAEFMANIPHHFGQCVPDNNPVVRVNYTITGDEMGEMDFRIVAKSNQYADYGTYYQTLGVVKNPKNAGQHQHFDFEFPLKELLSQQKYSWMAISNNKTHSHNMLLQARSKPVFGQMSQWKDMDTAVIKHRCVPQLAVPLNGGNSEQLNYGGQNAQTVKPELKVAPVPLNPITEKPKARTPATVKPELKLAPVPLTPITAEPATKATVKPQLEMAPVPLTPITAEPATNTTVKPQLEKAPTPFTPVTKQGSNGS